MNPDYWSIGDYGSIFVVVMKVHLTRFNFLQFYFDEFNNFIELGSNGSINETYMLELRWETIIEIFSSFSIVFTFFIGKSLTFHFGHY